MALNTIYQKAFFSTVRLRTRSDAGEVLNGTAFVFEYISEDNTFPFLVTSKQMVMHAEEGRMALFQAKGTNPNLGKGYTLDIEKFGKLWFHHPDDEIDVSITPFVPFVRHVENTGVPIHFDAFSQEDVLIQDQFASFEAGDDLLNVGYPPAYWDRDLLLPVTRKTTLSSPAAINYAGVRQCLLDTPMKEGWLGSPVLTRAARQNASKPMLVGMIMHGGRTHADDEDEPAGESHDMSVMIRTEVILEAIAAYLKEKGFI